MKRSYGLLVVAVMVIAAMVPLIAATRTIESKITAVTVYNDRALVTRSVTARLEIGDHALRLEGIPLQAEEGSIRASLVGSGALIGGINHDVKAIGLPDSAGQARLQAEIDSLSNFVAGRLSDQIAVLDRQKAMLESFAAGSGALSADIAKAGFDARNWATAYAFIGGQLAPVVDSLRLLGIKQSQVDEQIRLLKIQFQENAQAARKQVRVVEVIIAVDKLGDYTLNVEYIMPSASWSALYNARLVEEGRVELSYFGVVNQQTGEDWSNVELTLSTAQPGRSASAGELVPRLLSVHDLASPQRVVDLLTAQRGVVERFGQVHVRGGRESEVMYVIDGVAVMDPLGRGAVDQAMNFFGDVVEDLMVIKGGFDAEYGKGGKSVSTIVPMLSSNHSTQFRVLTKQTIASGAKNIRTPIAEWTLQGEIRLISRPKNQLGVYRYLSLKNETGTPLLPGRLNLFADSDYIGSLHSPFFLLPNQEFELAFGVDDRMEVKREIVNRRNSLDGEKRKLEETVAITLINHSADSVTIDLEEALPISSDSRIKVKFKEIVPSADSEEGQGINHWLLALAPGEERLVSITYEIEHPASVSVVGL